MFGSTMGHEISHGFDIRGKQFDRHGSYHNWWTKASQRKFDEKIVCMIDQYNNYTITENNLVNVGN